MPSTSDPDRTAAAFGRSRTSAIAPIFGRRTIAIVYIGANAIAVALVLWSLLDRSALLTPVGPDFRASMIGLGAFFGVLVAAIDREAWLLGFGGHRAPSGIFVVLRC